MAEKKIRVAIVGYGTVGSGVAKILLENADSIAKRSGIRLELAKIVDIDITKPRGVNVPENLLSTDISSVLNDKSIEIAAELIGGTTIAKQIQLALLKSGKHVVTANKALLAEAGGELYSAAIAAGKCIAFEASCAGGIPIISAMRTGLAANDIQSIYGIVNGTCNYILSSMSNKGLDFQTALKQAQQKGYAEADPTLDVSGGDTAHKLVILASIAFGAQFSLSDVQVEGIENINIMDIRYGREMGYTLKLLAIGERNSDGAVSLRVHPSFLHRENPLARVSGAFNAICVFGHAVGQTMFYGRGAGMMPTASAVVADMIEVAIGNSQRIFENMNFAVRNERNIADISNLKCRFYIRIMAQDKPGVVAKFSKILGDEGISISGVLQREGAGPDNTVPVVITTHQTTQKSVWTAIEKIAGSDFISGKPVCVRIIDIPEDND